MEFSRSILGFLVGFRGELLARRAFNFFREQIGGQFGQHIPVRDDTNQLLVHNTYLSCT